MLVIGKGSPERHQSLRGAPHSCDQDQPLDEPDEWPENEPHDYASNTTRSFSRARAWVEYPKPKRKKTHDRPNSNGDPATESEEPKECLPEEHHHTADCCRDSGEEHNFDHHQNQPVFNHFHLKFHDTAAFYFVC